MAAKPRKARLPKTKSPEEWQLLLGCIDTRYPTAARNHALISLMYATALRVGEALALHDADLDFERMRVHVREGKTGERYVPLPDDPALRRSVERWRDKRAEWATDSRLLFLTKTGAPLRSSAVRRSMALYGKRSAVGSCTPHMARHACATELLAHGASPIGVQRILGHRHLSTTLTIYAHAADSHAAEAMAKR